MLFTFLVTNLGGKAWDKAGLIWYKTLGSGLPTDSSYETFAGHTVQVAGNFFGSGSRRQFEVLGILLA